MSLVAKEQAQKEVNNWLNYLEVGDEQKKKLDGVVSKLVTGVCDGFIQIDQTTFVLTQKLKKPIGKEAAVKELEYQPNIIVSDIQKRLIDSDPSDRYATVFAHICASTGEDKEIIGRLDLRDYNLADSIIVFFML